MSYISWTGNALGELIWWIKFLVLYKFAESLSTILIVIQFQKAKFGGADSRADELVYITLIFRIEKQLPILTNMLLKLLFKLNDMLQN